MESVAMDMAGLRRLVREGCYHAALELTGRFLSAHGQGLGQPSLHTHKTLQMWGARLALLVVMQQFREAEVEMEAFGELVNPDLFYQYNTQTTPTRPVAWCHLNETAPRSAARSDWKPSALSGQTVPATAHLSAGQPYN
ncbi:Trafficking protein particle complex subunit 12, partial [Geodia barretti]